MVSGRKHTILDKQFGFRAKIGFLGLVVFLVSFLAIEPVSALVTAQQQGSNLSVGDKVFSYSDQLSKNNQRYYLHKVNQSKTEAIIIDDGSGSRELVSFDVVGGSLTNKQTIDQVEVRAANRGGKCDVPVIGTLLCPTISMLGSSIDWVIGWIDEFMEVRPFLSTNSAYYKYWETIKNVANIAFIGFFLIMIFSHLTNIGISNYEIKKIMPKIIIYAILVNISFFVAALAIDLSNIVGRSLTDLFISISPAVKDELSWDILSRAVTGNWAGAGLGIAGGASVAIVGLSTAGGATAAVLALAPIMLSALLSAIATFIALSIRQVLIIALAILSPIALVFNVLPKTESLWKKYLDLFKQMLIIFPMFTLIHGFSILVSRSVIAATPQLSLMNLTFALIIRLVPIFLLPKIMKMASSTFGNIYDKIRNNSLSKKIESAAADRIKAEQEAKKREYLGSKARFWQLDKKLAQYNEDRKKVLEKKNSYFQNEADARVDDKLAKAKSGLYYKTKIMSRMSEDRKAAANARLLADIESIIFSQKTDNLNNEKDKSLARQMAIAALHKRTYEQQKEMGISTNATAYLDMLEGRDKLNIMGADGKTRLDLLKDAAGIAGEKGQIKYLSKMLEERESGVNKHISNAQTTIRKAVEDGKLDYMKVFHLAMGDGSIGEELGFDANSSLARQAAITEVFNTGDLDLVQQIIGSSASDNFEEHRDLIAKLIVKNKVGKNARFLAEETIDAMRKGIVDDDYLNVRILDTLKKGKYSMDSVSTEDIDAVKREVKVIKEVYANIQNMSDNSFVDKYGRTKNDVRQHINEYQQTVQKAFADPRTSANFRKDAREQLESIMGLNF